MVNYKFRVHTYMCCMQAMVWACWLNHSMNTTSFIRTPSWHRHAHTQWYGDNKLNCLHCYTSRMNTITLEGIVLAFKRSERMSASSSMKQWLYKAMSPGNNKKPDSSEQREIDRWVGVSQLGHCSTGDGACMLGFPLLLPLVLLCIETVTHGEEVPVLF